MAKMKNQVRKSLSKQQNEVIDRMKRNREKEINSKITFIEPIAYAVAKFVHDERGIIIGEQLGLSPTTEIEPNVLTLLTATIRQKKTLFEKLFDNRKYEYYHHATIWFNNECRGAKEDKKWCIEINGRENWDLITGIAYDLVKKFNVPVEMKLTSQTYIHPSINELTSIVTPFSDWLVNASINSFLGFFVMLSYNSPFKP